MRVDTLFYRAHRPFCELEGGEYTRLDFPSDERARDIKRPIEADLAIAGNQPWPSADAIRLSGLPSTACLHEGVLFGFLLCPT